MFKVNCLVVPLYFPLNTPLAVDALAGTAFAPLSNPENATLLQVPDAVSVKISPLQIVVGPGGIMLTTGTGLTDAVTGTLGALTQFWLNEYSNSTLEMLVPAPNSLQISCGLSVVSGNYMPRR